jgi:hypothetical protein
MFLSRMMTTKNVGVIDRVLRALPSLAVAGLWWNGALGGWTLLGAAVLAAMLLVTSLAGACSIYYMLGFSTCRAAPVKRD